MIDKFETRAVTQHQPGAHMRQPVAVHAELAGHSEMGHEGGVSRSDTLPTGVSVTRRRAVPISSQVKPEEFAAAGHIHHGRARNARQLTHGPPRNPRTK